jgi:hypothetical protein
VKITKFVKSSLRSETERLILMKEDVMALEKKLRCEFCRGTACANTGKRGCHACGSTGYFRGPLAREFAALVRKAQGKQETT